MFKIRHITIILCVILLSSITANVYLCISILHIRGDAISAENYRFSIQKRFEQYLSLAALSLENVGDLDVNDDTSIAVGEYDKNEVAKSHYQLISTLHIKLDNGDNVDTFIKQLNGIIDIYISSSYGEDLIRANSKEIAKIYREMLHYKCDFNSIEVDRAVSDLNVLLRSFQVDGIIVDIQTN